MTTTPRLGITQLEEDQALPEVVVNEGVLRLEMFATRLVVKSKGDNSPPGSPAEGDAYLVGGTGTGAWTGQDNKIAQYINGTWAGNFLTPKEGWEIEVEDEDTSYVLRGGIWVDVGGGTSLALDDITDVDAPSPADGDVLTWVDADSEWQAVAPSAGGGGTDWALAGTGQTAPGVYDFAVDGAKANIDFAGLGSFNEVILIARGISYGSSVSRLAQVSVDNGSTFFTTSGDYITVDNAGVETAATGITLHNTATGSARTVVLHIKNMKGVQNLCQRQATDANVMFVGSSSDINAVRFTNSGAANTTAGTVRVYAR